MKRSRSRAACLALLPVFIWMFSAKRTLGQGCPEASSPKDDSGLQLRLSAGGTTYRQGEVIPLELSFTSSIPHRYQIDLGGGDRTGCWDDEQVLIDPKTGTSDPMQLYLSSWSGCGGDKASSFKFLSTTPTVIHLVLNEWVRFDRPGTYWVSVISDRVSDTHNTDNPCRRTMKLISNAIELRIITPDAAWQQAQMRHIRAVLSQAAPPGSDVQNSPRELALEALRFLGTADAARDMAKRLRGEDSQADWICMFGLIGSPHREAGLEEMNKLFGDPNFPVSDLFLTTMSILPLDPNDPPERHVTGREENLHALQQELAGTLWSKRGKAFIVSLDTVMSGLDLKKLPELRSELLPELIETFRALPLEQQVQWLQYNWQEVKDPAWVPLLRTLALHYEDFPELRESHAFDSLQLSGTALMRWYELDPEGARSAVLAEIMRPKPRYDAKVLGLLPDKALPQVEDAIAEHFLDTDNSETEANLASLLFRYADAAVLPDVLSEVAKRVGTWACEPQDDMLAYVLKVDPETATPLIERAIAARGPQGSGCRHMVFTDIAALENSPVLEALAVRSLDDPDPEVAANAADYLGEYGSAKAEGALWNRYDDWAREWSGRASDLRFVFGGKNLHAVDASLGYSLARALATGAGWLSDGAMLRRIEALGADAGMQEEPKEALRLWRQRPFTITYGYTPFSPSIFSVAQYNLRSLESLEAKLTQFPKGTKFVLEPPGSAASAKELKIFEEILEFARKKGITVVPASAT